MHGACRAPQHVRFCSRPVCSSTQGVRSGAVPVGIMVCAAGRDMFCCKPARLHVLQKILVCTDWMLQPSHSRMYEFYIETMVALVRCIRIPRCVCMELHASCCKLLCMCGQVVVAISQHWSTIGCSTSDAGAFWCNSRYRHLSLVMSIARRVVMARRSQQKSHESQALWRHYQGAIENCNTTEAGCRRSHLL